MTQKEEYVYMSCICTGYEEASRNDVVYDLTGRKLMSNGSKSSLQKGIYIINGHKITK